MAKRVNVLVIPNEIIVNKIYLVRGQKVMIDADLAELYGVETKRLKEQVKRNSERFPEHFAFELTADESQSLRSQFATSKIGRGGTRYKPMVFTEHGVLQLSNVLKSKRATEVSIKIIDVFVQLREVMANHNELKIEVDKIKRKLDKQDKNIEVVFQYLDELIQREEKPKPRKQIGFTAPKKKK
jgi:hypothetical protein